MLYVTRPYRHRCDVLKAEIRTASDILQNGRAPINEEQKGAADVAKETFTLSAPYLPKSNTLKVFVNGQKAVLVDSIKNLPTPDDKVKDPDGVSREAAIYYEETDDKTITFSKGLADTDSVVFKSPGLL